MLYNHNVLRSRNLSTDYDNLISETSDSVEKKLNISSFHPGINSSTEKFSTEISIRKNIIENMFNTSFGKSFLNLKPKALLKFEEQLKNYIFSPKSKIVNKLPWLQKQIQEENLLHQRKLIQKINLGKMVFFSFREGKKKIEIKTSSSKEKYLENSNNYSHSATKDIISNAFIKVKFWDKNSEHIAKILENTNSIKNNLLHMSKFSKNSNNEISSIESPKSMSSLLGNFKQAKNFSSFNNNIINEQEKSLIKEVENESTISHDGINKKYFDTKIRKNKNHKTINKRKQNEKITKCFDYIINKENSKNNNIKYFSKTSSLFKKSNPVDSITNNNLKRNNFSRIINQNINKNYLYNKRNSVNNFFDSYINYSNTENNNNFSLTHGSFRTPLKNTQNNFFTPYKKSNNLNIYSNDIQKTIYKQLNNLNKYVKKCNNRLIDYIEHSDNVMRKLNHSLNKRENEKKKENLNLKLLLSDENKNRSHRKKFKKINNIKLMIKNVKKEVGVFDKFDYNIKRSQKKYKPRCTKKISSLSNEMVKLFSDGNQNSEKYISGKDKIDKEEKKNEDNISINDNDNSKKGSENSTERILKL